MISLIIDFLGDANPRNKRSFNISYDIYTYNHIKNKKKEKHIAVLFYQKVRGVGVVVGGKSLAAIPFSKKKSHLTHCTKL